ncbi:hypothetical protein AVEN_137427-1, partial [Araneus ventricosus]
MLFCQLWARTTQMVKEEPLFALLEGPSFLPEQETRSSKKRRRPFFSLSLCKAYTTRTAI